MDQHLAATAPLSGPASLESFLARASELPTVPAIATRILEAIQSDDQPFDALARAIATDPALTAKVLSVANSPLYAPAQQVLRLDSAIRLIGLNALKNIALSFVIVQGLSARSPDGFDFNRFVRRAITGAVGAEMVAKLAGYKGDLFASALLQDVGMMVFALCDAPGYARVLDERNAGREPLCAIEARHFGFDHAALGAELLRRWGLPQVMLDAIARHHEVPPAGAGPADAAELLHVGDKIASVYFGYRSAERIVEIEEILARRHGIEARRVDELVDSVATQAAQMMEAFDLAADSIKPYSQLLLEANAELRKLNLSYEQLVMELRQSQARAERLAIELREANAALREAAARDGLTGLYNHRSFQDLLRKEVGEARRYERPLALILFDIDRFKVVNDTWGHPAGDAVLRAVSAFAAGKIRTCDVAARYGGEEFALILPETDARGAMVLAERLREGIHALAVTFGQHRLTVTISLGVSDLGADAAQGDPARLIEAADKALYAAKRSGRNRAICVK
jgi:diguanylate cyclase (GGDEF)-like protein